MEPQFNPAGQQAAVLLTEGAAALLAESPVTFALQCVMAELLLGLGVLDAGSAPQHSVSSAQLAVALQVGFQVEQGVDAHVYESQTIGPISQRYRGVQVHPQAATIAAVALQSATPPAGFRPIRHV